MGRRNRVLLREQYLQNLENEQRTDHSISNDNPNIIAPLSGIRRSSRKRFFQNLDVEGSSSISIWVYGNSFESFLVAVVVPDRKALEDWAAEHNLTDDYKSLCQNLKARKYILDELNSTGQKQQLRGFELLKAVHLEPNPFDIERDLMTPTFKLKRPQLLKYYKERVEKLYSEAKGGQV